MARGGHSPTPAIPKVSYTKVEDEASSLPAGVHDNHARFYGFNDSVAFQRPEYYIRYIEPLDIDLAKQVEYDMDEQDQEWLDAINVERHDSGQDKVSYETFEIIMDRLEKEWFDLTKNIPKPDMALPSEDSTCAICDDAEGENANAIVFCDGCNLAVHQDCYGVPYIPEGQWLCRKCTVSPENPVSCILCPNEGGAFKQTVSGDWAHLLCAIWVPETRVANDVFMEPITGVERINKQRWKLKCSLCGVREGACIQCGKSSCFLAFHTTCARREKLLMPMKSAHGSEPATLACYCEKHLPPEQLAIHEAAVAELEDPYDRRNVDISDTAGQMHHTPRTSKKARAYAKTYKLGAPLVPAIIVSRIMEYTNKLRIRHKDNFIHLLCRYWSLKREARRGAPLLKRLHLEPWSANAGKVESEEDKAIKLEYLMRLRNDLEQVRMLAEQSKKREIQKMKQTQVIHDVITSVFFPHAEHMRRALEKIMNTHDRNEYFKNPVSRTDVPDYFDVIKKPMCWNMIEAKLDANEYWNLKDFEEDIHLVVNNAMMYNKRDTLLYRAAERIKRFSVPLLEELRHIARVIPPDSPESGHVGDLEPPLELLELLVSPEAIDGPDMPFLLGDKNLLTSLFSYELGEEKPPPPPPPRRPPKPKRDRKAEAERRRLRQLELDGSAGFRAAVPPRTRRERAKADAFEAEAQGGSSGGESTPVDEGADGEGEVGEGNISADGNSRRGTRWRRERIMLPGQTDVPPVMDDVDMQKSFTNFDSGWILPTNTRRGGRAPVERQDLPPPRKKQKTDRQRSTLSMSTPAVENLTLHENSPLLEGTVVELPQKREKSETVDLSDPRMPNSPVTPPAVSPDQSMDTSVEIDTEHAEPPPDSELDPESEHDLEVETVPEQRSVSQVPVLMLPPPSKRDARTRRRQSPRRSPVVIEEIDTPATRRAKQMARKQRREEGRARAEREERERQNASAGGSASAGPSLVPNSVPSPANQVNIEMPQTPGPLSSPLSEFHAAPEIVVADEADSDLTSLSDSGEAEPVKPDGRLVVRAEDARKAAEAAGLGPATIKIDEGEVLEGGTLVWAKAETYPWWPAVVFEEDDPDVPPNVIKDKITARSGMGPLILVQFWDQKRTWQWLLSEKIRLFDSDKEWDRMMLDGHAKVQRFKTPKAREACRSAWRLAMAEMETGGVNNEEGQTANDTAAPPAEEAIAVDPEQDRH